MLLATLVAARELMGSVEKIPKDSVVSVNDAVQQIQSNDSNSSSPSSMSGMPEHLRPPGLKIVGENPNKSGKRVRGGACLFLCFHL